MNYNRTICIGGITMAVATTFDLTEYLACAHAMTANFGLKGISVSKIEEYENPIV
jgi:hypothetical protein